MHIEMRRHWWMCTSIDQRPWSTLWLHCAITSVAAGNQWSGPVKAISKWFHWFAPLVSCSDWLDREAGWESGLRGLNPLKRPVSLCRLGAEPSGKTRQPVWTGGWTLWKDPSACVDGGLNPLERPISLCGRGAEPSGKTRQPVWTGGWTLWKDPSACVDWGLNPLERPVSLCGRGAEPSGKTRQPVWTGGWTLTGCFNNNNNNVHL